MESINFITSNSSGFHKLELSKSLLHFVEYDFTYFWEQTIDFGSTCKKTGRFEVEQLSILRNLIVKCHPYYEAKINTEFSEIALDCIIEYICRTRNIGLESLWVECISPANAYQKAIFQRVSRYKTKKAMNEWVSIIRAQQYAKAKLDFIFEGKICSVAELCSRSKYFDLAYSVCATETGYPMDSLPSVERFELTQIPGAVFMINKASRDIYKRLENKLENAPQLSNNSINDNLRDSYAFDAFEYMKDLKRPSDLEMYSAIENFRFMPEIVYKPNCFKAIIDFEFSKMLENGIILRKCENCGKYYNYDSEYKGNYCDRVNSSGKTCRDLFENNENSTDKKDLLINSSIEEKSNLIYQNLKNQVGKSLPESEFNDWSEYLKRLKSNVKTNNATSEELESFLNYTEKMYGEIK